MRNFYLGLLMLFATLPGCASPDPEDPSMFEDYNGFPWPSLLKKNAARNPDESYLHPQFSETGRFTRPGTVTPNPDAADSQTASAPATTAESAPTASSATESADAEPAEPATVKKASAEQ